MKLRIVVDAMGSDHCPSPDVAGAVLAAREYGDTILLVGEESQVRPEIDKHDIRGLSLEIVHARDVIKMMDKPSQVGKEKPESSMYIGMRLVQDGLADAFVTAGNTGAALSIATLYALRRIPGVRRPALTGIIRTGDVALTLLDVGANADSKPDWIAQFALMGEIYARLSLKIQRPRVGLLSNGEEEGKGNELVRTAAELVRALPINFVGNVEPKDLLSGGADVVVTDGFVGNITLKTLEAATRTMGDLIRAEITRSPLTALGGILARPAFRRVYKQVDPFEIGGAPLLGINGVVIIGHGRSNQIAIKNAVGQARKAVLGKVVDAIASGLR
ncbi:MAG: phosphate acyltransferase PlsX [Anaerolineae bacterium]|nr:phosphate acyltransferase PlsX [Anaerolineae bacterium]NUQ02504.1 phosphate acyltransferase PlsX [Anaerolineae bacterium]